MVSSARKYATETNPKRYRTQGKSLSAAARQNRWSMFADRTAAGANLSPVTDEAQTKTPVIARFIRLTITAMVDLPESADPNDPVNAKNARSIFELKVFGK